MELFEFLGNDLYSYNIHFESTNEYFIMKAADFLQ